MIYVFELTQIVWIIIMSVDLLLPKAVDGSIVLSPEDGEATVGSRLVIRCQTDIKDSNYPIEWHFRADPNSPFVILYKRGKILNGNRDKMSVIANASSGQYDLVIFKVSLENAGAYTCLDEDSHPKAEIVVFERYPSDEFCRLTPDRIQMSCEMRYRGNMHPSLEWSNGDRMISSNVSERNGIIKSTIQCRSDDMQNSVFSCRVTYEEKMVSKFNWTKTNSIESPLNETKLVVGDCNLNRSECPSFGNFECNCTWTDDSNHVVANGSHFQLTNMPSGNYTTTVTCFDKERSCSFVAERIEYSCKQNEIMPVISNRKYLVVIMVVFIFSTLAIITAAMIMKKLKKPRRYCGKNEDNDIANQASIVNNSNMRDPSVSLLVASLASTVNGKPMTDTSKEPLRSTEILGDQIC